MTERYSAQVGAPLQAAGQSYASIMIGNYILPAKKRGESNIVNKAQLVHKNLELTEAYSHVCRAIDSSPFFQASRAALVDRQGPPASDKVVWRFRL